MGVTSQLIDVGPHIGSKGCGPDANCSAGMKAEWLTLQRDRTLNPITPHETRWCHENVRKAHSIRFYPNFTSSSSSSSSSSPSSSSSSSSAIQSRLKFQGFSSVMDHPIPCHPMASGWLSSWSPTSWAASRRPRPARPRSSGRRRAAFYGCAWKGRMDSCCRWMLISPGKNVDLTWFNHWNTNEKWGSNGFYWNRWGFHPETLGFYGF